MNVVALLLYLLNPKFWNSEVRVFKIFIRVITIDLFSIQYFFGKCIYTFFSKSGWSWNHPGLHVEPPLLLGWEPGTEYLALSMKQVEMDGTWTSENWGYFLRRPFSSIWLIFDLCVWKKERFWSSELAFEKEWELIGFCFWGDGNERKRKSLSGIFGKKKEIGRREILRNNFFLK